MIYIQKKNKVTTYYTSKRIERAIETLLQADEDLMSSDSIDGYEVDIVPKGVNNGNHNI